MRILFCNRPVSAFVRAKYLTSFALLAWLTWSGLVRADESNLVAALRKYEQRLLAGGEHDGGAFFATFTMAANNSMNPGDGFATNYCEVLWASGLCLMSVTVSYEHPPVFAKSSFGSQTVGGPDNCIVWRSREKWFVSNDQRNEYRDETESSRVNPDGTLASTNSFVMLCKQRIGDPNGNYIFHQFLRGVGRGIAPYMRDLTSMKQPDAGVNTVEFEAIGDYAGFLNTTWHIRCEPGAENLIREASLIREEDRKPILTVTTSGLAQCPGLALAAQGTLSHGRSFASQFQVLTLTSLNRSDEAFKLFQNKVISKIDAPLPPGHSQIMDRRGPETKVVRR